MAKGLSKNIWIFFDVVPVLSQTEDAENEDPAAGGVDRSRRAGRKSKVSDPPGSTDGGGGGGKKVKVENESAEAEVERILSNKVLDTNIPELDDMMTTGSKYLNNFCLA